MNESAQAKPIGFNPFEGNPIERIIPVIPPQREIWLACKVGGEEANLAYNQAITVQLKGSLRIDLLRQGLSVLLQGHQLLRSKISGNGENIIVSQKGDLVVEELDFSVLQPEVTEKEIADFYQRNALRAFDLQQGPLVRFTVIKREPEDFLLNITAHHIICDGWSLNVIVEELARNYSLLSQGKNPLVNSEPDFSDYAKSLLQFERSEEGKETQRYWEEKFGGYTTDLPLPLDFSRPSLRTYRAAREIYRLEARLAASLRRIVQENGCSFVNLLLAGMEVSLASVCGRADVVIGLPAAGQVVNGDFGLVGHCVNLLPIRSIVPKEVSFLSYLQERRKALLDDLDHQNFTFSKLLGGMQRFRDFSRVPLVPFVLNVDLESGEGLSFGGLSSSMSNDLRAYENFEIFLNVVGSPTGFSFEWTYNSDLFLPSTINRLMESLLVIFESVNANTAVMIRDIPIGGAMREEKTMFAVANPRSYSMERPFQQLFHETAQRYPEYPAAAFGNHDMDYRGLDRVSNQLANYLIRRGAGPDSVIGLAVDRSLDMLVAVIAILKTGATYLPLDPEFPSERLSYMVENANAQLVFVNKGGSHLSLSNSAEMIVLEEAVQMLPSEDPSFPVMTVGPDQVAYILYTSGSTGRPKGVMVTHKNLTNLLLSLREELVLTLSDKWLAVSTISFDISINELLFPLVSGASVVIADSKLAKDGQRLVSAVQENGITVLQATPPTWRLMLQEGWGFQSSLRAISTGEALAKDLAEKLLPRVKELWNGYGPTETTVWSSLKKISLSENGVNIGKPIGNTVFYLLDAVGGPVNNGEPGELFIGGAGVALGYLNLPELTAERFLMDPFSEALGSRMYKTGDLAVLLPNGDFQCLGRLDNQVKIRGYRIELEEIEYALQKLEGIKQAVVGVRSYGPGDDRLVAFVKPLTLDQQLFEAYQNVWRNQLKAVLPPYMVPVGWVMMEDFPLTPNKKIDRAALPNPNEIVQLGQEFDDTLNDEEGKIASIWAETLGLPQVKKQDNFFDMGGHSLTAVKMIAKLEQLQSRKIPVITVFQYPVFGDFCSHVLPLQEVIPENPVEDFITPVEMPEMADLTFEATEPQAEIFAACLLGGEDANRAYNLSFSLELKGHLNVPAFEQALAYLQRHELLRATFSDDGMQIHVSAKPSNPYEYRDISAYSPTEIQYFLDRFKQEGVNQVFDLQNGPLTKFSLIKLSGNTHLFTIMVHHIVCDGWSIDNLFRELGDHYRRLIKGEALSQTFPPAFSRFATEKQAYYHTEEYRATGAYWKSKFQDGLPVLELPTDRERLPTRSFASKRTDFFVSFAESSHLTNSSKHLGANTATFLRVVLEVLLYRVCRQSEVVTGMPVAGHLEQVAYHDMVGHCVNMLPIRAELSGELSFRDYLDKRKQEILADFQHQSYTYGSILKDFNVRRDTGRAPLISFVLNYEKAEDLNSLYPGMDVRLISNPRSFENFEIVLNVSEDAQGLWFNWGFQTALFSDSTIARWHRNFLKIAETIVADPHIRLDDMPLLYDQGFRPARIAGASTALESGFLERFAQIAKTAENQVAMVLDQVSLTYEELDKRSNQFARFLISSQIQPNDRIGLYLDRTPEQLLALLGILKAGATYVPLDVTYPLDRVQTIIDHADLKLILSKRDRSWVFDDKKVVYDVDISSKIAHYDTSALGRPADDSQIVYVLHTSGSTGSPKGVCMGYRALSNLIHWQLGASVAGREWKTVQFSPITFDVSFQEIFATWCSGGTLVLISDEDRLDANRLLDKLVDQAVNRLFQPFVALQALCEAAVNRGLFPVSLREVMTAGEQLQVTPQVVAFFKQLPGAVLFNQYGPTETHVVTELRLDGDPSAWPSLPGIGRPINNTTICILGPGSEEVGLGQVGELCVAGFPLADHYLGSEELTREKFCNWVDFQGHTFRIYRTGDLAKLTWDGNLDFLGRGDHQVKIRGFRVELGEIETVINSLPFVVQSVVKVQTNGIGQQELVGYIQTASLGKQSMKQLGKDTQPISEAVISDLSTTEAGLILSELKGSLPAYMHPKILVAISAFPKTSSGKIDRKRLPQVEASDYVFGSEDYIPPKTTNERLLCEIWARWLNQKVISVRDNFFELGGYSLIGIKVMAEIEKETGIRLPLITLFNYPTVEQLAGQLGANKESIKWDSLVAIKPEGTKKPIYIVHGGGLNVTPFYKLVGKLDLDQPIYGIQARGLNGVDEPFETIEEMAAYYLSEILDQNPYGPYILAGYSFGGVIAFEMAQQLTRMGKQVDKLILFDTYANQHKKPTTFKERAWVAIRDEIGKRAIELNLLLRHPRVFKNKKVSSYRKKKAALMKLLGRTQAVDKEGIMATQERIIAINKRAAYNYQARKYDGEVYFFRAGIWDFYETDLKYLGWKPFADRIQVVQAAGEHVAMFEDGNVELLAENLRRILKD
ncbi:MAG: amino acid adenylation domain-containing protein [Lunatimonas sp.]|uniref:amino acid adenylation domain-containing protein n=1 Tax=Lunatimonas sp. TaxID=2060141 RepID=UPI00263A46F3|nr:non-ribosomal peptide synthetase [Lunatimonas sp.]MCC5937070.1 amino acid adenylation domain-containing protein [Lunatimonas sp.]